MQKEPVDNEAPRPAAPGRSARIREVRDRLAACLGVDPAVVDSACQEAEDRTVGHRRTLLIYALADNQRQLNRLHGEQAELHARALEMGLRSDEVAGTSSPAVEVRSLAAEIGAVSGRSQRSVQIELGRSDAMANLFEPVQVSMKSGAISRAHALVIVDAGLRIVHPNPAELARRREEFCRVVLEKAASTTPGRIKAIAERAAEELTEESLDERFERARRARRVTLTQLDDGLGELTIIDSYAKLRLVFDRTTRQARVISDAERRAARDANAAGETNERADSDRDADAPEAGAGDPEGQLGGSELPEPRSLDEVRADVLGDSFLRATPEELKGRDPIKAKVAFVVPTEGFLAPAAPPHRGTPAGPTPGAPEKVDVQRPRVTSTPALLDGYIPVPTSEVRRLIDAAPEFERIFTDPIKGTLVDVDSYRPTSAMRRRLAVRDGRCRFVGCMMPANRCEIDHTEAWEEGGPTSLPNLGHLCKGDHTGKHHGDWAVEQLPDGIYEWQTPTGFAFRDEPVQFGRLTSLPQPQTQTQTQPQPQPVADAQTPDPPTPREPGEPHKPVDPGEPRDPSGPGDPGDPGDEDRRKRFPKIGYLEEFRRERAAKKAAAEAEASWTRQPEFRPTAQQGRAGAAQQGTADALERTMPDGGARTGDRAVQETSDSSHDPPPF